jgi:hypothetical protein
VGHHSQVPPIRPWISGASFQDDFAGLPELLHLSHAPGLSQPGNSQIADLVFGREKCAEAGQKNEIELPGASEAAVSQLPRY